MNVVDVAHLLRDQSVFRNTSLRHLTDLAELARPDAKLLDLGDRKVVAGVFVLTLRGRAVVQQTFVRGPGEMLWSVLALQLLAQAQVPTIHDSMALPEPLSPELLLEVPLEVEGAAAGGTLLLPITENVLLRATRASTSFGTGVDLTPLGHHLSLYDFFRKKHASQ
jgi:hypothetical protein